MFSFEHDFNPSDNCISPTSNVKVITEDEDVALADVLSLFRDFLCGCGFVIDGQLEVVPAPSPSVDMEEVELCFSDELFAKIAMMAHEQDITINTLINELLKARLPSP